MQVYGRLQDIFGSGMSAVDMFKYPTIYHLAQYLSQQEGEQSSHQRTIQRGEANKAAAARQIQRGRKRQAIKKRLEDKSE
jgi:hypothetical protein